MPASTYIDRQKYPKCIIESNIKNGPIDNIIDQSYYPEATIGCYMYKSVCGSTPHTFSDHIRGFVEPNAGAHYYVQSANSTNFSGAKLTVMVLFHVATLHNSQAPIIPFHHKCH